ncbi:HD domain-containing protein [bacterium]|nr:HD domain-containing protein [bacterium]
MSKMVCPGQDTRFWGPGDVFDVACAACGYAIEFFRDDASLRCPRCGARVENPQVTLGCAQWCEHAEKCLGYDPKTLSLREEKEASLADQLIEAMKAEFGDDQPRITHALRVLENAQELLRHDAADPRVVVAAALLHDIGIQVAERRHGSAAGRFQELEGPPIARRILEEAGIDEKTIEHVCRIVGSHHSARDIDTPEFRILWDADRLVNLPEEHGGSAPDELGAFIARTLKTARGRALARERYVGE